MYKRYTKITRATPSVCERIRVAAYARVSAGTDEMLNSLSAQVSYYSALIQKNTQWEYVGVYADEAYTGTKDERPEFQRLLADCRAGLINLVLVKSISRFARNTVTLLETVRELKCLGIDVYFERENIHTQNAEGEFMLSLIAAVAQEESRSVSENCKWRIRKQYQEGVASFHNAYGYRLVQGKPEIIASEAEVVRFIFRCHNHNVGYFSIARILDSLGCSPPHAKQWNALTIRYILRNERYVGDLVLQKAFIADHLSKRKLKNNGQLDQILVQECFPAIISREEFELAQFISSENTKRYTPDIVANNEFCNRVICAKCGKPYKRKIAHGNAAWNCGTFMRKGKAHCHGKQIPEETLMAVAREALSDAGYCADALDHIDHITVPAPNHLVFHLSNGQVMERTWQDRSRSDSWNAAARAMASIKTKARYTQ